MDLAAMAAPGNFPFNIRFQKVFQRQNGNVKNNDPTLIEPIAAA
jgi:hypothetical protein